MAGAPHPGSDLWAEAAADDVGQLTTNPTGSTAAPVVDAAADPSPDGTPTDPADTGLGAADWTPLGHEEHPPPPDPWDLPRDHPDEPPLAAAAPAGMPGRGVIVVSVAASIGCAALDLALTGGLTLFFDLCFITICLVGAMAVRRRDLFTAGVLAPLMFGGVIAVVAVVAPEAFAPSGGLSRVYVSGLAQHAAALVVGYAIALATVSARFSASRPAPSSRA